MGVPVVYDFVKSSDDHQALDLLYGPLVFGRPYVSPPSTPGDRVGVLRAAFDAALRDEALLADAAKMRLPIQPMSGADVEALVMRLLATPATIVKRLTDACHAMSEPSKIVEQGDEVDVHPHYRC